MNGPKKNKIEDKDDAEDGEEDKQKIRRYRTN